MDKLTLEYSQGDFTSHLITEPIDNHVRSNLGQNVYSLSQGIIEDSVYCSSLAWAFLSEIYPVFMDDGYDVYICILELSKTLQAVNHRFFFAILMSAFNFSFCAALMHLTSMLTCRARFFRFNISP